MILVDHTALHDIASRVFSAAGSEPEEARVIADHLVGANLRGHDSHGVGLIPKSGLKLRDGRPRHWCNGNESPNIGRPLLDCSRPSVCRPNRISEPTFLRRRRWKHP